MFCFHCKVLTILITSNLSIINLWANEIYKNLITRPDPAFRPRRRRSHWLNLYRKKYRQDNERDSREDAKTRRTSAKENAKDRLGVLSNHRERSSGADVRLLPQEIKLRKELRLPEPGVSTHLGHVRQLIQPWETIRFTRPVLRLGRRLGGLRSARGRAIRWLPDNPATNESFCCYRLLQAARLPFLKNSECSLHLPLN
jgi:hypothetical protein